MIKRIITAFVVVGALALGGCAGFGVPTVDSGTGTLNPLPAPVGDLTVQNIQDAAVKACGFVPTATTVSGIVASFFPGGAPINSIVTSVVNGICNAVGSVSTKKAGPRRAGASGPPTVGGVKVEGYFTR